MHWLRNPLGLLLLLAASASARQPLLVISIDGLDHRYLRDRDALGLKIPNLRRMIAEGAWADGVIGVMPTVTFPSHTTLVTGARPDQHGIVNNNVSPNRRYFEASYLKVATLWDAARKAGLKSGAIHWPVTVDAAIDFNLPEYFERRQGGGMDFRSMEAKSTPGLIDKINARFPSFAQEWVDDRVRTLATVYLLRHEKLDLILLHLVDHDSEAHSNGPFTREAKALIEHSDELLGRILAATPKNWAVAIVSDHGFERVDKVANLAKARPAIQAQAALAFTDDREAAEWMRSKAGDPAFGIGREIPEAEWKRFSPARPKPLAVFEPMEHYVFTSAKDAPALAEIKRGDHGYWPLRKDYRSTFLLWGAGVKRERLPELDMLSIAGRFARILDVPLGKD
jgi:predicted AlkP superfamily pyrophosphatase or phosphodiesterase